MDLVKLIEAYEQSSEDRVSEALFYLEEVPAFSVEN